MRAQSFGSYSEVGVLNDDDVAGGGGQPSSDRGAFASIALVEQDCEGNFGKSLRAVCREFEFPAGIQ
jgi:hypothetical protein